MAFLKRHKRTLVIVSVVAIFTLLSMFGLIQKKLFASSSENIHSRGQLNRLAVHMIVDHPFAGVGLNNAISARTRLRYIQLLRHSFWISAHCAQLLPAHRI